MFAGWRHCDKEAALAYCLDTPLFLYALLSCFVPTKCWCLLGMALISVPLKCLKLLLFTLPLDLLPTFTKE